MNYLAHLYIADDDPESIIGNLMGDFVKGRIEQYDQALAPAILQGIQLHRKVDSYCDSHGIVVRSKNRMPAPYRRYAGILIDMFYDHFLALNWSTYSEQSLRDFADHVYRIMDKNHSIMPARMQRSMHYMVEYDLLMSYRQQAGIERALSGIERRFKRPVRLAEAVTELDNNYTQLADDFAAFFPQLLHFAEQQKVKLRE